MASLSGCWLLAIGYQLYVSNSSQQVFDLDLSGLKKTGAAKTNPSSEYFLRQLPLNAIGNKQQAKWKTPTAMCAVGGRSVLCTVQITFR